VNEAIRVSVVSLGCARNLVDSEVLLGHVAGEGLQIAREPEDADVVVVNTCGFIEAAKQESIDHLLEACRLKEEGSLKGVVAVGCLAERYAEDLANEIPELDAVLGISDYSGVPALVRRIVNGSDRRWVATVDGGQPKTARSDVGRVLLTPKSYAYLRISEGCDHKCAFCAIPKMRGRNRSKPLDVLIDEARSLGDQGVRELVVVAEDSTAYGLDIDRKRRIHELIEALANCHDGIEWVRLMYAYPHTVRPELTTVMREHPKVVPYLDIPIQHVSSPMLRAMNRGVSKEQVTGILWRLRDEVPGIAVRTTMIVGFPGETDDDFEQMRDFVEEYRFERLGVFAYSQEEGTPAHDLEDQIPEEVAQERLDELMRLQASIHAANHDARVGSTERVLIDGRAAEADGGGYVGRTTQDAPEVDCVVAFRGEDAEGLSTGMFVDAVLAEREGYDFVGRVVR
jgi:ribosomal protein S12 methylthiotransferase